ncbi:tumor necrosis factor receptor superfamily member 6 [Motacilla alba alba]|uniref:tumor necrosis factor receptor superfamily member 6 n=1 Tax=Motacilla alba alba TaxID=1094192 RepID=UPI0018D590D7|nr:tumor necrosis factor receptor superfamily member 6 [Motacilla alba alba]
MPGSPANHEEKGLYKLDYNHGPPKAIESCQNLKDENAYRTNAVGLVSSGPCLASPSCRVGVPGQAPAIPAAPGTPERELRGLAPCHRRALSPGLSRRCPRLPWRPEPLPGAGSARPAPRPPRAVPCRAVRSRAVPCRAVPCRAGGGPGRVCQHGRSRRGRARAARAVPQGRATSSRKVTGSGGMGTVRDGGGVARGLLALLLVCLLIIEIQCKNDTEAQITSNRRIISRREITCKEDEYNLDTECCKKCRSGFVKNISCPKDIIKHCAPCEKGKEFMNHPNDLDKCLRCRWCDSASGWEVVKNCTPEENTQCACAKNYFCDPAGCHSCLPCTKCESGVIEKQCTSASDTVCGTKEPATLWWIIALVVLVVLLAIAGAIVCYKRKQKGLTINEPPSNGVYKPQPENVPLIVPDVDLSSHIPGIVAEMTLPEVKKFVRHHHVSEPAIDQSIQDYPGDTSEQKIKLFRVWYQSHGMKGAYGTLISSLRELKMCAVADTVEEKLKAAISSSQEGGRSYNPDTERSKTCTQEGGNSYNESAELSKAYTVSLEET